MLCCNQFYLQFCNYAENERRCRLAVANTSLTLDWNVQLIRCPVSKQQQQPKCYFWKQKKKDGKTNKWDMSRKGSKQIKIGDAKGYEKKMINAPSSLHSTTIKAATKNNDEPNDEHSTHVGYSWLARTVFFLHFSLPKIVCIVSLEVEIGKIQWIQSNENTMKHTRINLRCRVQKWGEEGCDISIPDKNYHYCKWHKSNKSNRRCRPNLTFITTFILSILFQRSAN